MEHTTGRLAEGIAGDECVFESLKDAGFLDLQKGLRQEAPATRAAATTMAQVLPPARTSGDGALPGADTAPFAGPMTVEDLPLPAPAAAPAPADAPLTGSAKKRKRTKDNTARMKRKRANDPVLRAKEAEERKKRRKTAKAKRK